MSSSRWHPLKLASALPTRAPPLLIQRNFASSTYSIYVTDLTNIWGETLSRREILQRSLNEDTSIDPSEDAGQMRILLEKLKKAVSQREDSEDDDIEVEISPAKPAVTASSGSALHLKVTYELPSPLLPLLWTFKLQPLPYTELTNMLVLPLLNLASLQSEEVHSLLQLIKDKDFVIGRMQDALEETRSSVANILGGGASRRRGLEKFDPVKWRKDITEAKSGASSRPANIVKVVFQGFEKDESGKLGDGWAFEKEWDEAATKAMDNSDINETNAGKWWERIEASAGGERKMETTTKSFVDEMETDGEDDVPPRKAVTHRPGSEPMVEDVKGRKGKGRLTAGVKRTTHDLSGDEDDEFAVQRTPSPPITKAKVKAKSPTPVPPKISTTEKKKPPPPPVHSDDDTTDDDDLDGSFTKNNSQPLRPTKADSPMFTPIQKTPSPMLSPPLRPKPTTGIKKGIGKIGGRKPSPPPIPSLPPPPSEPAATHSDHTESEEEKPVQALKPKAGGLRGTIRGKIGGKIGGKEDGKKVEGNENNLELPARATSRTPQVEASEKREPTPKSKQEFENPMDEDEADRKRRQLQQELEAKKKAPAKKKRKF